MIASNNTDNLDEQFPDMSGILTTYDWLANNETCNMTTEELMATMEDTLSALAPEPTAPPADNSTDNATGRRKRSADWWRSDPVHWPSLRFFPDGATMWPRCIQECPFWPTVNLDSLGLELHPDTPDR